MYRFKVPPWCSVVVHTGSTSVLDHAGSDNSAPSRKWWWKNTIWRISSAKNRQSDRVNMEGEVKYYVLQKHHYSILILSSIIERLVKAVTEIVVALLHCRRSQRCAENGKRKSLSVWHYIQNVCPWPGAAAINDCLTQQIGLRWWWWWWGSSAGKKDGALTRAPILPCAAFTYYIWPNNKSSDRVGKTDWISSI